MCKYCIALQSQRGKAALGEKGKFWPVGHELKIAFMGGSESQQSFVRQHAAQWLEWANLSFKWDVPVNESEIRISFVNSDGSWSYVGMDALGISTRRATMNFGWLDAAVVLHEFGHALGLGHEHQNPEGGIKWDIEAVISDLSGPPNYWDVGTIMYNVIEPYEVDQIIGTVLDPYSIMMYAFPSEWTLNGFETGFNEQLSDLDKEFISTIYPRENNSPTMSEMLQKIFLTKAELNKLKEETICRIGDLIGADTDKRNYKRENTEKVWRKINQ